MTHQSTVIHALFEAQVAASPDSLAVIFEDKSLTYRELNERANRLAHRLIRQGVVRGSFVGLCTERSLEMIVGVLGILKAGGAYVPLDPAYPNERLAFMLTDAAVSVVLGHAPTAVRLKSLAHAVKVQCLDVEDIGDTDESVDNPTTDVTAADLAYLMYTSGSTGRPKGVLISQQAVVHLVHDTDYCHFGPTEVFLHLAPLAFDASTFEIWGPLLNGGRVVIMPPCPPSIDAIRDAIQRHSVTTLFLTTALFNLVVDQRVEVLRPLRQLFMGGELVSPRHVLQALVELSDGVLRHVYGPTECTTFATCFPIAKEYRTDEGIPIGRPIAHTTAYVLNEQLHPVTVGTAGELYLGGSRLSRGYLNLPELTTERFVADPFSPASKARLYRTGDRVRVGSDGNLEFLGRYDDQVKIAGHRIEPGEIEVTLRAHPVVRQCVVIARTLPSGTKQLAAYVVADSSEFSAETIKQYLGDRLPSHLVPAQIVRLDSLPLTPNGKINRAVLSESDPAVTPIPTVAPTTSAETEVAAIWAKVLCRNVSVDDNFFDLGGTSLQLLEVHAELTKTRGQPMSVMTLFECPTVRALARRLAEATDSDPALVAARERARIQKQAMSRRRSVS